MSNEVVYDFSGKSVLIVGGSSGIGLAAAEAFHACGASVLVGGLGPKPRFHGVGTPEPRIGFVEMDATRAAGMAELMTSAETRLGRVDIALNNVGVEGSYACLQSVEETEFDRLLATNVKSVWLGMKFQIPHMLRHGGGVILNTSSTASIDAIAMEAVYSATKHAVVGLTRAAALEVAHANIRINAIAPGPVDTALLDRMIGGNIDRATVTHNVPMKRISTPHEIAGVMLWACSSAASFVTGSNIIVDGGVTVG
jgi:NAD(P)-dependent dehydrogenase (short-subunit alcohol dehydrogenase family)